MVGLVVFAHSCVCMYWIQQLGCLGQLTTAGVVLLRRQVHVLGWLSVYVKCGMGFPLVLLSILKEGASVMDLGQHVHTAGCVQSQ